MHKAILKITCSLKGNYFVPSSKSIYGLFQRYDSHYYLCLIEIKVNGMKDLICDKLDLYDLNKNNFQIRDQHPHLKDLICQTCKRGPGIPLFIFPKTTWLLKVRWCEDLPFTTFQSQKSTSGGSKRKGKGPPP
jgi:hypothetical protein